MVLFYWIYFFFYFKCAWAQGNTYNQQMKYDSGVQCGDGTRNLQVDVTWPVWTWTGWPINFFRCFMRNGIYADKCRFTGITSNEGQQIRPPRSRWYCIVNRTGFWVYVVLVLNIIRYSCHYFLDIIYFIMIFIMIVVTVTGIFMAINYLLIYTLGFLYIIFHGPRPKFSHIGTIWVGKTW